MHILIAFSLLAAVSLDTQMTPEEKQATGLYKLNASQKTALEKWIDTACNCTKNTETKSAAQKKVTLSENLMNSRFLKLSDNTLWSVRPSDVPIAQGWITPVEIVVSDSGDPLFPSRLTNKVTDSFVYARQVQKLPSQPPQSPAPSPSGQAPAQPQPGMNE